MRNEQKTDTLSLEIKAFHLLSESEKPADRTFKARATITTQEDLDLFRELDQEGAVESDYIDFHDNLIAFDDLTIEQAADNKIPVLFHPEYRSDSLFAWTIDDVLKSAEHRIDPPADFFVAECDYRFGDDNTPQAIERYFQVTLFTKLLRDIADHVPRKGRVIFLGTSKLEVEVIYDGGDLTHLEGIDLLDSELRAKDHHHLQRLEVFRNTMVELLSGVDSSKRMRYLIQHFDEFIDRYRRDFQLYARDFTATKMIEEVSKKQIDLVEKIDGLMNSMQNRLFAIPITLVLAAGQLSPDATASTKNLLILFGWLIFATFIAMMIRNQQHTLSALGNEVGRLKSSAEDLHVYEDVKDKFTSLNKSERRQRTALFVVQVIISVVTLFVTAIFLQATYPKLVKEIISCFFS